MAEEQREVCKCENCGNEAEMVITCELPDEPEAAKPASTPKPEADKGRRKKSINCTHCGNEAEMWLD